jgi:hypothetical protein
MNNYIINTNHIEVTINSLKYGIKIMYLDLDNIHLINEFNWHLKPENNGNFYAHTNFYLGERRTGSSIHRMIYPEFKMIDHINGNGLDNRKENLRETTYRLNNKNKTKRRDRSSKYKGVYIHKSKYTTRFYAKICVDYKNINLGSFKLELDAAKSYNEAVIKYFGNNYVLNDLGVK